MSVAEMAADITIISSRLSLQFKLVPSMIKHETRPQNAQHLCQTRLPHNPATGEYLYCGSIDIYYVYYHPNGMQENRCENHRWDLRRRRTQWVEHCMLWMKE